MAHEIREVQECLGAGQLQSQKWPMSSTILLAELMDEARRQMGVHYTSDDASITLQQAASL
jgi:hypothetical protein